MKRILSLTIIAASFAFAFVACKDDFNEEDFLRLQSELKLKQDEVIRQRIDSASEEAVKEYIAAANEAGDLLAVSLVVRENGNALEGVTVTLSSGTPNEISAGRAKATTTGTTDASGMVVFDRVTIGSGTAQFSKQGYVSATATYDFGLPGQPLAIQTSVPSANGGTTTVTRYAPPLKRFEEAAVTMISATPSNGSTATITGKVTIENDLTNTTPEVPAGIVLRANLTPLVGPTQGFFTSYVLADNSTLGRATIATDGTFTMTVPATAANTNITLIVPNIEGTSRMAVNGYDNGTGTIVPLPNGPEYRDVPTSWGPQAVAGFGNIVPAVAGAKLVFPAPPVAGAGLAFDFTPVPRPLSLTGQAFLIASAQATQLETATYRIKSRGNYSNGPTPTVTVNGGDGMATALAQMRTYVSALTVSAVGSNYNGNVPVNLVRVSNNDVETIVASINVPSQNGSLPSTINLASFAGTEGFDPAMQHTLNIDTKSLKITVAGNGIITGTFKTEVFQVLVAGGQGFTSAPTFVFSGGGLADGSPDHAQIEVLDFPVNWTIEPNNSASTDYAIVPGFTIDYPAAVLDNGPGSQTDVDVFSVSGTNENGGNNAISLQSRLTISSGDVVKRDPAQQLRTKQKSGKKPTIIVTTATPVQARKTFLAQDFDTDGSIISFPGNMTGSNGVGYAAPLTASIQPTIAGAPGSGAAAALNSAFDATTLEYQWNGNFSVMSRGSGYLRNLNQRGMENAVGMTMTVAVQAGKTTAVEIKYGTGNRKVNIN